jgi:hypothetical protein
MLPSQTGLSCPAVGIAVGTRKIPEFIETSTVFIVQSNRKIVLNQRIESFHRPYIYYSNSYNKDAIDDFLMIL